MLQVDLKSMNVVAKSNLPEPRFGFGVCYHRNKIYVIGGMSSLTRGLTTTTNELVYDCFEDLWQVLPPLPKTECRLNVSVNYVNDKLIVCGGHTNDSLYILEG